MTKRMRIGVAAAAAALAVAAPAQAQDFEWSGRIDRGDAIEIKGINGPVRATLASGSEVIVTAEKRGRRSDEASVRIETVTHEGGITVCAVYPEGRKDRPNVCAPGRDGHLSSRDNDVEVSFAVQVPEGVRFIGNTVNGDVEAAGLRADARVRTVNGDARVSTSGLAEASTVNGSIDASMGRADWSGELEFSTVNGGITIELPDGVDADVRASTVNGGMETDFPLTVSGRFSNRRMRGTIGEGGRDLVLETVNGSIRLRRRS